MAVSTGQIASVTGRYYAMDRDNRWERVKVAYDAMVKGEGEKIAAADVTKALQASYDAGVTDEFIKPLIVANADGSPVAVIEEGDVVLCFNFRTDRGREITQALTQKDFPEQGMTKSILNYITMTNYDSEFVGVKVIFDKDNLQNTLGEVIAGAVGNRFGLPKPRNIRTLRSSSQVVVRSLLRAKSGCYVRRQKK